MVFSLVKGTKFAMEKSVGKLRIWIST